MSLPGKRLYCLVFLMCISMMGGPLEGSDLKVERSAPAVQGLDVDDELSVPAGAEGQQVRLYLASGRPNGTYEVALTLPGETKAQTFSAQTDARGIASLDVLRHGDGRRRQGRWLLVVKKGAGEISRWWLHLQPKAPRVWDLCPTDAVRPWWLLENEGWSVGDLKETTRADPRLLAALELPRLEVGMAIPEARKPSLHLVVCKRRTDPVSTRSFEAWLSRSTARTRVHRKVYFRTSTDRPPRPDVTGSTADELTWEADAGGPDCHRFRVELLCSDDPHADVRASVPVEGFSLRRDALGGAGHYWRVRCEDGCGSGPPSRAARLVDGRDCDDVNVVDGKVLEPDDRCWSRPVPFTKGMIDPCFDVAKNECLHTGSCARLRPSEPMVLRFPTESRCAHHDLEVWLEGSPGRFAVGADRMERMSDAEVAARLPDALFMQVPEDQQSKIQEWRWRARCLDASYRSIGDQSIGGSILTGHMQCDEPPSR